MSNNNSQAGYKSLTTFVFSTVIYDLTVLFCRDFSVFGRLREQMTQAARSCKSNIAEGYTFQSTELYLKLLGTAQGSIRELGEDFEDFLRQNNLEIWSKEEGRVGGFRAFRAFWVFPNIPNTPKLPNVPEEAANMLLTFCQMESYLLSRQIESLRRKFINEGGFSEKLFKERAERRRTG